MKNEYKKCIEYYWMYCDASDVLRMYYDDDLDIDIDINQDGHDEAECIMETYLELFEKMADEIRKSTPQEL